MWHAHEGSRRFASGAFHTIYNCSLEGTVLHKSTNDAFNLQELDNEDGVQMCVQLVRLNKYTWYALARCNMDTEERSCNA